MCLDPPQPSPFVIGTVCREVVVSRSKAIVYCDDIIRAETDDLHLDLFIPVHPAAPPLTVFG